MATISTEGIAVGQIIRSEHLLRVINALNGVNPIDIIVKGSLSTSGSLNVTGSTFLKGLPNVSRTNVITYDPTTGQLSYLDSASLGVITNVSQPGGSDTQVQYNSGSVLAGNSNFRFLYNSSSLTLGANTPTGVNSFTQGNSLTASGNDSHAQGSLTRATNNQAHAEGVSTWASGIGSHAEGQFTTASGNYSHAEGLGTIAAGNYQHVQGQYNISSSAEGAFIIGNGTSLANRRNLVFTSGSQFQITGSLDVNGSARATNGLTVTGSTTLLGSLNVGSNVINGSITVIANQPQLLLTRGIGDASILLNTGTAATPSGSLEAIARNGFEINSYSNDSPLTAGEIRLASGKKAYLTLKSNGSVIINSQGLAEASAVFQVNEQSEFTGSLRGSVSALTIASTTASINFSTGNFFTVALVSGSNTHISASNIRPGQTTSIRITQPNPAGGTVTFSSAFKQSDEYPYIPNNENGGVDILTVETFDTTDAYIVNVWKSQVCEDCVQKDINIGTQFWMKCNLTVDKYQDGTPIPQVTSSAQWAAAVTGAWCYVNNDPATEATYGKIYNGYAAAGIHDVASLTNPALRKQLAPIGYHVPTLEDFQILTGSLGGTSVAGGPLKQRGLCTWATPNAGGTNSTGFSGVGAGFRNVDGDFTNIGISAYHWSSTDGTGLDRGRPLILSNNNTAAPISGNDRTNGYSVRCLRD
jgi:uncharacterized protein (TIGR02145 family)